ncbi:hypothetical protein ACN6KS_22515 [Paenibacillus nitricinens]|uniref:hypothetical protein n=1 Tax=Paenibacillus nitricinens TaxID=3367691 RepID=UPI003F850A56
MENRAKEYNYKGGVKVAVNDKVEIISSSNPEIYGMVATVIDIKNDDIGTELRIKAENGLDIWIDAEDAVIY